MIVKTQVAMLFANRRRLDVVVDTATAIASSLISRLILSFAKALMASYVGPEMGILVDRLPWALPLTLLSAFVGLVWVLCELIPLGAHICRGLWVWLRWLLPLILIPLVSVLVAAFRV